MKKSKRLRREKVSKPKTGEKENVSRRKNCKGKSTTGNIGRAGQRKDVDTTPCGNVWCDFVTMELYNNGYNVSSVTSGITMLARG